MTDTPSPGGPADEPLGDELRQHPQAPAEGQDDEVEQRPDVPRVHPEDPTEG